MVMLASKMPKLRLHASSRLHLCTRLVLAAHEGCAPVQVTPWDIASFRTLQSILEAQDWGAQSLERIKQARQQVMNVLGVQPPAVRKTLPAKQQAADEANVDMGGYQVFLNDVARGL